MTSIAGEHREFASGAEGVLDMPVTRGVGSSSKLVFFDIDVKSLGRKTWMRRNPRPAIMEMEF